MINEIILALAIAAPSQPSVSVFGIELGKPLSMEKCRDLSPKRPGEYGMQGEMCWYPIGAKFSEVPKEKLVWIAILAGSGVLPDYARWPHYGVLLDGNLVSLTISSDGEETMQEVEEVLAKKFGAARTPMTELPEYWLSVREIPSGIVVTHQVIKKSKDAPAEPLGSIHIQSPVLDRYLEQTAPQRREM